MLIEFTVKNFKSIKEETTLSLLASNDKNHQNNLIKNDSLKKDRILKSAVIYGANASGKSNIFRALNIMRTLVKDSHNYQQGDSLYYQPFRIDMKNLTLPTEFEIVFIQKNIQYNYSFSYNANRIINETLYWYPKGKKALIFSRKKSNTYKFTEDKKDQLFYSKKTPENVLFLSRATQLNYNLTKEPLEWFTKNLKIILATDHPGLNSITSDMINDSEKKSKILNALVSADLGIDDVLIEKYNLQPDDLPTSLPEEIKNLISKQEQTKITTIHNGVPFDLENDESDGTKRLFALIGPIIDSIENNNIMVIDELDTKLHHLLNVFILKLFHCQENNKSQLIFNTHNTNLLDQDIFRRDQIWFTEKNPTTGETDLFSLLEFHPRKDKNIQKGYLSGRYGGLPYVKINEIFS